MEISITQDKAAFRKLSAELGGVLALLLTTRFLSLELHLLLLATVRSAGSNEAGTTKTVLGLELLRCLLILVNESEPGSASATELGLEAKDRDVPRILHLVHGGKLLGNLFARGSRDIRVNHLNHKLLSLQQRIGQELLSPDCILASHI